MDYDGSRVENIAVVLAIVYFAVIVAAAVLGAVVRGRLRKKHVQSGGPLSKGRWLTHYYSKRKPVERDAACLLFAILAKHCDFDFASFSPEDELSMMLPFATLGEDEDLYDALLELQRITSVDSSALSQCKSIDDIVKCVSQSSYFSTDK